MVDGQDAKSPDGPAGTGAWTSPAYRPERGLSPEGVFPSTSMRREMSMLFYSKGKQCTVNHSEQLVQRTRMIPLTEWRAISSLRLKPDRPTTQTWTWDSYTVTPWSESTVTERAMSCEQYCEQICSSMRRARNNYKQSAFQRRCPPRTSACSRQPVHA